MATFSQSPGYNAPTKTQNFTTASVRASQTPTGNKRIPTSGNGLSSRGVILNDPALESCAVGGVRIDFQLVRKIALGGAKPDVPVNFAYPVSKIWIASKDHVHLSDSLYFHLSKLNKTYPGGNAIDPDGSEQWFDMTFSAAGGLTFFGKVLHFRTPIIGGYFDIGHEAGGTDYNIMVAGSDDVIELSANNLAVTS